MLTEFQTYTDFSEMLVGIDQICVKNCSVLIEVCKHRISHLALFVVCLRQAICFKLSHVWMIQILINDLPLTYLSNYTYKKFTMKT